MQQADFLGLWKQYLHVFTIYNCTADVKFKLSLGSYAGKGNSSSKPGCFSAPFSDPMNSEFALIPRTGRESVREQMCFLGVSTCALKALEKLESGRGSTTGIFSKPSWKRKTLLTCLKHLTKTVHK